MRFATFRNGLRRVGAATIRAIPPMARDSIGLGGAAAIVYGVWQIHQPSAWIVAGVMMVVIALRLAAAGSPPAEDL